MIVIRIEMWPRGRPERKYHLGTAVLTNDGTGTGHVGHYKFQIGRRGVEDIRARPWRTGEVKNFPRQRLGVWDLLFRALKDAIGKRNGE